MNKKLYMLVFIVSFMLVSTPAFTDDPPECEWEKILDIPYFAREFTDPGWTGPAAAKMILFSPVVIMDPLNPEREQTELWDYISANFDPAWSPLYPGYTDPVVMRDCLREYDARTGFTYNIYQTSDYDAAISQKIVYTIDNYEVPPAVPIDGGLNWAAVFGVGTSSDPSAGPYSICWFLIHDPRDPGVGNYRMISYEAWENSGLSSVFLHIDTPDPFPDNMKKIAVCDPDTLEPLRLAAPEKPPRRETVLTPNEAREAAIKALKKYNILDKPGYQHAEKRIRSGKPILVKRMNGRIRADYYIVPLVKRSCIFWKRFTGAVLIDAYSGAFLETSIAKKPISYPYLSISFLQAKKLLSKKIKQIEGISYHDLKVEMPTLTWEPGLSVNPYFPLWKSRASIKGTVQIRYLDFNKNVHLPFKYPPVERGKK